MQDFNLSQIKMPDNTDTIDLTYLGSICDNDKLFMREMIENFMQEMPNNISYIAQQIEEANWLEVKKLTHKMKPALQFMGLPKTLDYVRAIEQHSKETENLDEISPIFEIVTTNINHAIDVLEKIVEQELSDI